ncbi:MAG: 2-C-methyl-D-erythritol 4-phosphate cytidylyltransferase [Alicyclobacillus herbarius]|uniref:2-C-methyl-D-erythritol 4-phosphate cytidylyltransferase n=1 Tax=Alicyclobacillus herbarius TaxID=122960 RepID=UPI000555BB8C|nr:2-C-methyl-D-erythritol 4-phosphate cytidylyltransferase [Alicyclobacillus herbarius]MCL6631148.1 2-C-methyl-D-erythritol 4-phosphate cytidylyltransferase [Alicyclobacillus herbarius]
MRKVFAVILASGTGQRMGSDVPKQFLRLGGRTILEHTLRAFDDSAYVDHLILVVHPATRPRVLDILEDGGYHKPLIVVDGGATRQESAKAGIEAIQVNPEQEQETWVLIHDAARPLVSEAVIARCVEALASYKAVSAAVPATDTVFQVDDVGQIETIPNRAKLWQAQTPQGFHLEILRQAHHLAEAAADPSGPATDDCGLVLRYGLAPVHVVKGDVCNLKITYPTDLAIAEQLLKLQKALAAPKPET